MPLEVGAQAPDFTLKDQNNQEVSLADFRGKKNVLLVFYPLAFTGTCQGELCKVRDELPKFENDDTAILAISVGLRRLTRSGQLSRDTHFPCCRTSGRTVKSLRSTRCSTTSWASRIVAPLSSTKTESFVLPR